MITPFSLQPAVARSLRTAPLSPHRFRVAVGIGVAVWVLCFTTGHARAELPACPIMTENQATPEYFADYEGKRYYFCCEGCVADFKSDPSRIVSLSTTVGFDIPTLQSPERDSEDDVFKRHQPSGVEAFIDGVFAFSRKAKKFQANYHLDSTRLRLRLAGLLFVIGFCLYRIYRTRKRHDAAKKGWQFFKSGPSSGFVVILLILALADTTFQALRTERAETSAQLARSETQQTRAQLKAFEDNLLAEQIHFGTFINYGFPPRPRPSTDAKPSLQATYYRGNDERGPQFFNGGQYLTATFQIQVVDANGDAVQQGTRFDGGPLFLKIEFERAKDTSSGYFSSEYMKRMYVTGTADRFLGRDQAVADRTSWVETVSGQTWTARFPIPPGDRYAEEWKLPGEEKLGPSDRRGVVYLCEDRFDDDVVIGGRFHYGIEYDIRVRDGVITPDSMVLMGSTYSGRNFARYQITDDEWLSTKPIPEKP